MGIMSPSSLLLLVRWWLTCVWVMCLGAGGRAGPVGVGLGANLLLGSPIVDIGRCRVQCIKQITIPTIAESKSKTSRYFQECWKICEERYRSPKLFRPICDGKYCTRGCEVACIFWNSSNTEPSTDKTEISWAFPEEVDTDTDFEHISMKWQRPVSHPSVPQPHPIIYTLLMRENNGVWKLIGQTYEESYKMPNDEAAFVPEFLIQAIDETGVIASSIFHVKEMIFRDVIQAPDTVGALAEGRWTAPGEPQQDTNTVNLTHRMIYNAAEGLTMELTWNPPSSLSSQDVVYYEVVYILLECGVYPDLPTCSYADDLYSSLVPIRRGDQPRFTTDMLLFNTRYAVHVRLINELEPNVLLARVVLDTLQCFIPSDDFKYCLLFTDVSTPLSPSANPDVTEPPLLTELMRDVVIERLPQLQDDGTVLVNISWTYISDPRHVNFSLTFYTRDDYGEWTDNVLVCGVTHYTARLLNNTLYDMVIELIPPTEAEEPDESLEGWGEDYLQDSSQRRQFNTSQLQLATQELPQAVRMNRKNLKAMNGVIIGVTCVSVLVVFTFIGVFLYKKRQSFKDIIVPRATVAKSNSYKSSVGGKTDYSNQLMVFCDEWELDPQQLKFSTPLGQGAFGKVVTGYYSDHKVAIKLVKEGAPLSYKEDLVAEINLMKRLGTHPNIVCLVGACTVQDPIALVMEYVPYGNLQNFLKRCRLEGDLQKRANGPSEIQYSMLQGCGGIENGVITPTDMLSFARQVAMAMEYLAEKKYVHRDLAARNVLLHFNKVVKVCDFGLSRDIFHDNQYKKLTNGKLPLKWMAIESLRDRVFTTQSDVWSFGILLWEIVTMGASPYPSIALADLYYVLSNHYRMDKPSNCSNELYAIMRACWADSPGDRPSFTELREQLEDLMAEDRDYLVLEGIDVPLSASESSSNPTASDLFSGEMNPSQAACQLASMSSESGSSASASASAPASGAAAGLLRPVPPPAMRRLPMTIDVCIHQKSTERLMRPSESDSSP